MFEKEIKIISEKVKNYTINKSENILFKNIYESEIPIEIKDYFLADLNIDFIKEKNDRKISEKFNSNFNTLKEIEKHSDFLTLRYYNYSKSEFENKLENSINFALNLLCRPQWTIINLIFQSKNLVDLSELNLKLKYISKYKYFKFFIEKYIEINNKKDLQRIEIEKIIRKIDEEVIINLNSDEISNLSKPIFDFIAYSLNIEGNAKIPIKSLMYFYNEKGRKNIVNRLDLERRNGEFEIDFNRLKELIHQCNLSDPFDYSEIVEEKVIERQEIPIGPLFTIEEEKNLQKNLFFDDEEIFKDLIAELLKIENELIADERIREYFATNKININSVDAEFFYRSIINRIKTLNNK